MPLQLILGVISNNPPFVHALQGQTNQAVWDIARAIYLIKGETASVILLFTFLAPSQGACLAPHLLTHILFNLSLYLAVLHPGINYLLFIAVKL